MKALVVPLAMTTRMEVIKRNIVMILIAGTEFLSIILVQDSKSIANYAISEIPRNHPTRLQAVIYRC